VMTASILIHHSTLVLAVIALTLAAIGIGARLQRMLSIRPASCSSAIGYAYFFGQAILATAVLVIQTFFTHSLSRILLLLLLSAGWYWCFRLIRSIYSNFTWHRPKFSLLTSSLLGMLVAVLSFHIFYSFHKPSEWDEVAYHFPVMKELAEGTLKFPLLQTSPYEAFYRPFSEFYGSLPYNPEAFASLGYILSYQHPSTAHLVYMISFIFFLVIAAYWMRDRYDTKVTSLLTILLLLTLNSGLQILFSTGLIDTSAAIYQVLACLLLITAREKNNSGYLWLSLLCLGAAFGHKFTSAFMLPIYLPWAIVVSRQVTTWPKLVLLSPLWLVLGGGIWYLKNILLHLNPVYPLYFGHQGMSQSEYVFLTDTLIDGLRSPITLQGFYLVFMNHYGLDRGVVLTGVLVILGMIFIRKRIRQGDWWLLATGACMFFLNFVVGSQVSRYVLFLPIILLLLSAQFVRKHASPVLLILALVCLAQYSQPVLKSFWKSRIKEIPVVLAMGHSSDDSAKIGCVASIYHYCRENCPPNTKILNLWDAYTAVYYQDSNRFFSPPLDSNFDTYSVDESVLYLYSNLQWRGDILANQTFHRDLQPVLRAGYEDRVISESQLLFNENNCSLYRLQK
ncbi:MAG: hypothetical protein M3Q81_04135, partial [bacterium]|nr:hypothetical protein [bacterium]